MSWQDTGHLSPRPPLELIQHACPALPSHKSVNPVVKALLREKQGNYDLDHILAERKYKPRFDVIQLVQKILCFEYK